MEKAFYHPIRPGSIPEPEVIDFAKNKGHLPSMNSSDIARNPVQVGFVQFMYQRHLREGGSEDKWLE